VARVQDVSEILGVEVGAVGPLETGPHGEGVGQAVLGGGAALGEVGGTSCVFSCSVYRPPKELTREARGVNGGVEGGVQLSGSEARLSFSVLESPFVACMKYL
jgi:hypothetical protein